MELPEVTLNAIRGFIEGAISIFAIINPVGNLPIFAGLTEQVPPERRKRVFRLAGLVALGILVSMAVVGRFLMQAVFHIDIAEFMFGGGVVLIVAGVRNILSGTGGRAAPIPEIHDPRLEEARETGLAVSPIACPLMVGPGSIVTVMLIVQQQGLLYGLAATLLAFVFVWLVLNWAHRLLAVLGPVGTLAVGRVMQIFIVAIGSHFVFQGVAEKLAFLAR